MSAEEEGFENLNTMASTFIVLFLLSVFYSTTVTLFKVVAAWRGGVHRWPQAEPDPLSSGSRETAHVSVVCR